MMNLITTVQTLLKRLATNVAYEAAPTELKATTFGVITGNILNPFGDKVFIYLRKNMFDLLTDLEIVITSGVLKNDVAIGLIKPESFINETDLEDCLDHTIGEAISTLKKNQAEYKAASAQLELFPQESRLLEELVADLTNKSN